MAKQRVGRIKLQLKGGEANQGSIAPIFGSKGLSQHMMNFCKEFNDKTKDQKGKLLPVMVSYYDDKSVDFVIHHESVTASLMAAAHIDKGSGIPNQNKVSKISDADLQKIAEEKIEDLNAYDVDAAKKIIAGTARSMGIDIA